MRIVIPTKDRPGNVALAIQALALQVEPDDEIVLYDDGERPACTDYGTRFALDIATIRGAQVYVKRGFAQGIHMARSEMLADAQKAGVKQLFMVDDDIVLEPGGLNQLRRDIETPDAQYFVPVIALANNEAGAKGYDPVVGSTRHQQWDLTRVDTERIHGGAWTCAILLDLERIDVKKAINDLVTGPSVVEDYTLTVDLVGYIDYSVTVWHCMTSDQGDRGWEGRALAELRRMISRKGFA